MSRVWGVPLNRNVVLKLFVITKGRVKPYTHPPWHENIFENPSAHFELLPVGDNKSSTHFAIAGRTQAFPKPTFNTWTFIRGKWLLRNWVILSFCPTWLWKWVAQSWAARKWVCKPIGTTHAAARLALSTHMYFAMMQKAILKPMCVSSVAARSHLISADTTPTHILSHFKVNLQKWPNPFLKSFKRHFNSNAKFSHLPGNEPPNTNCLRRFWRA